ncbi:hypothetical protein PV328_006371 [Microctonus aethiopoides]|uniref:Uncharacterized protein n=1 Tax=Microctonus aethiopoides TaxID=144406 RepID=A0AA39FP97_9HYME|nr:hypothetical protein PV328_006371 [Microctonus aethiopoides]
MAGLFPCLLMIFQIIQQVVLINNTINLTSMKDAFDHINMLYTKDLEARKIDPYSIKHLKASIKFTNYLTDISQNLKYDSTSYNYDSQPIKNSILNYIENIDKLRDIKSMLNKYLTHVEYWYFQSLENVKIGSINEMRITSFIKSVLENKNNLLHTLFNISNLVLPEDCIAGENDLFSLIMKNENKNYKRFCGRTSSQQRVYYIIKLLIQTELKGFIAISQAYYFDFIFDRGKFLNYSVCYRSIREYEISMRATRMRLLKYFEIGTEAQKKFRRDVRQCDNILELGDFQVIAGNEDKIRDEVHLSNSLNKNFSHSKIIKISTEPQMSDIDNDKIVVGVKFINHDNAIHLQIKQRQISKNGFNGAKSKWKPVDVENNNKTIKINYENFFDNRKIFYLDDINIDSNHVVTGVKIQLSKDGKGFELHVHSTKYNYSTGQLDKAQKWYGPGDHPIKDLDYQRERIEINLNDSNDLNSNKFIQFEHSLINKDDGYHTIPYFDAQPVEVTPEFPLSGIGLFYKKDDRFVGSIAPRLFTQYIDNALESSFDCWKQLYEPNNIPSSIEKNESPGYPKEYPSQWQENFNYKSSIIYFG